eukprot:CAMPEP_0172471808 /NCGR_PEP_ID=MMETSP1065-20121228/68010_1 /TAXON_ID=265537 /ORGANISM="Amphiprora paludosa, Strain CCMP125" /LENGTH=805 /DNA_ID=CAMNT_0013229923 /DNA_START=68 /DNA_END=2482 /DNA_ORIENTATION=+
MTGTTAEEAVERAKAIAARIQQEHSGATSATTPTAEPSTTGTKTSGKRRRWGLAPEGVASEPIANDRSGEGSDAKKAKAGDAPKEQELLTKRMWISTSSYRPAAHYVGFMKDELEEVHKNLPVNEESGEKVLAALEGRGSGGKPPTPGMPLEPLHILLQATSPSLLTRAELLVDDLLQRAEEATVHPDLIAAAAAEEAKNSENAQESAEKKKKSITSTSLALATIQDPTMSIRNTSYKPASVAQLIGQVNHGGPGADASDWIEEIVPVPVGVVGFIIGKGGENIASMQGRTGAKVQVQRETESTGNVTHRNIQVAAPSRQALDECKQLIENIVTEKSRLLSGGSSANSASRKDAARLEEAKAMGHVHLTVPVPDEDVGLVIGKQGATIRSLQDRSGASIQVPPTQESKEGKRMVHITHPTKEGAEFAQKLIQDLLQNNVNTKGANNGGSNAAAQGEPQVNATILIPDPDVGLIIGRSGIVIRFLQDTTKTRIQIPSQCLPGQDHRIATISGPPAGCQHAQAMIAQIISDQSSAGVMAGAAPAAGGAYGAGSYGNYYTTQGQQKQQPRYIPPTEGQDGYSAEWAAYHAAQAAAATAAAAKGPASPYPQYQGYYPPYQQSQANQPWGGQQAPPNSTPSQASGAGAAPGAPTPAPAPGAPAPASDGKSPTPGAPVGAPAGASDPKTEQKPAGVGATAAHPPVPQTPARDAYYEQFFRYAYYYGEPAARAHYGAWAPPEGTKNPYGVNPNGVQAAPAAAAQPAPAPGAVPVAASAAPQSVTVAAAPASAAQAPAGRETSVRKVSNLPAW